MPQWNCGCNNCEDARKGLIPARTQSCIAISADGREWYLINASPDLRAQLNGFPEVQPAAGTREISIAGVFITNADLDHTLGLLLLREGNQLDVFATAVVRECLTRPLPVGPILTNFCGIHWHELPDRLTHLPSASSDPGLECRAIPLPGHAPRFAPNSARSGHVVALEFRSRSTGRSALIAPGVAEITPALREAMTAADAVLFDGTFWNSTELQAIAPGSRTAKEMGHVPVETSLKTLRLLSASRKMYVHINNTNPILQPGSPERRRVESAGIVIAEDGFDFAI